MSNERFLSTCLSREVTLAVELAFMSAIRSHEHCLVHSPARGNTTIGLCRLLPISCSAVKDDARGADADT